MSKLTTQAMPYGFLGGLILSTDPSQIDSQGDSFVRENIKKKTACGVSKSTSDDENWMEMHEEEL